MHKFLPVIALALLLTLAEARPRMASDDAGRGAVVVTFEGNKVFSEARLLEEFDRCLGKNPRLKGEGVSGAFDYCLWTVGRFLRREGYLQAVVGTPRREETPQGVRVAVPVNEGILYRLGTVELEGATVFSREQLLGMFDLKTGDIGDADAIGEWVFGRIRKAYADRGYFQYTGDIEAEFAYEGEAGVVNLKITVYEEKLFIVRRIEFAGNEHTPDQVLRNALLIKEDEPYCESRLHESLRKLDELGLFSKIDKDRDVDFKSDDEKHELSITVRVREVSNSKYTPR